jgi:hypothetical protein
MNTQLHNLIERQRQRMRELREDAPDLANVVADEVWDRFEKDVEEVTADGYMFDMATSTQIALSSTMALNYDEVFERHVLGFFERQGNELCQSCTSLASFDGAQIDLAGLRKGLKLRRRAEELIGQAIERAKPGLIGMLFLSSDPCSDAWEREHSDNATRLRSKLLELRKPIVDTIREELSAVIQTGRLAYIEMLEGLPGKLAKTHFGPETACQDGPRV